MRNIIYLAIALMLFSCTDDNPVNEDTQSDNFYALTVGNSWEYRWYMENTEGELNSYDVFESISIIGTETINDNEYYKFKRVVTNTFPEIDLFPSTGEYYEYYRDSLGYLVNDEGLIKFSNTTEDTFAIRTYTNSNFIDGINTTIEVTVSGEISEESTNYVTNAGAFDCLEMIIGISYDNGQVPEGKNYIYYADGIGLVSDDIVFVTTNNFHYRRMLESYTIQ